MVRTEVLQLFHEAKPVEVPKDVLPAATGWGVAKRNECLFLSFSNNVLSGILVEANSDKLKIYRQFYKTNGYSLR